MIARERSVKIAAVCCIAELLMCSTALGWGRKPVEEPATIGESTAVARLQPAASLMDSFPDAVRYSGTAVHEVTEAETQRMNRLIGASRFSTRQWWESRPHPLLESVLPEVLVFRVSDGNVREPEFGVSSSSGNIVLHGGKFYPLVDLNRLLLDAGFTFDSTEMPTTAKIAVLFATFGERPPDAYRYLVGEAQKPESGFPAITFLSVKRDTGHPKPSPKSDGIRVECLIDGVRKSIFVGFRGADKWGRRVVEVVNGGGLQLTPSPVRLPLPLSNPQRGDARPKRARWC